MLLCWFPCLFFSACISGLSLSVGQFVSSTYALIFGEYLLIDIGLVIAVEVECLLEAFLALSLSMPQRGILSAAPWPVP